MILRSRDPITVSMMKGGGCVIERGKLPDKPPMRTTIRLPADLIRDLKSEARRRGRSPDELAVAILRNVVADDLFKAVLDR